MEWPTLGMAPQVGGKKLEPWCQPQEEEEEEEVVVVVVVVEESSSASTVWSTTLCLTSTWRTVHRR